MSGRCWNRCCKPPPRDYRGLLRQRLGIGYLLTGAGTFASMMSFIVASPYVYIVLHQVPTSWFGVLFGANVAAAKVTKRSTPAW